MTDLSHDLRISREALEAAEKRAKEAERAVAALRAAAQDAWTAAGRVVQELQHHRNNGKTPIALAAKIDDLERATPATALASPIGSGWLSPEQGAEKVAAEREACALIADGVARGYGSGGVGRQVSRTIAFAIRSRCPVAAHPTENR